MELVAGMNPHMPMKDIANYAKRVESLGFDTLHVPEMIHDPFIVSGLALSATTRLRVRTGVALAFVRSPMVTALSAWDLANLSAGRFDLGLGSQIRQNIVERYGMPFEPPLSRLREYVLAVRSCFASFSNQTTISFEGDFYQLTRLQKEFLPEPIAPGMEPEIWLGAVGGKMTALASAISDGLITHPTNSHPLHLRNRGWSCYLGLPGDGDRWQAHHRTDAQSWFCSSVGCRDNYRGRVATGDSGFDDSYPGGCGAGCWSGSWDQRIGPACRG